MKIYHFQTPVQVQTLNPSQIDKEFTFLSPLLKNSEKEENSHQNLPADLEFGT